MVKQTLYSIFFFMLVFGQSLPAMADSVGGIVAKGNEAYKNGKFDDALSAYEKAAKEFPESARIFFNLGDAYYQKKEYEKAIEAFEQAALKSKEAELEAKSRFNLGNSRFREAEQKKGNNLNNSLKSYKKSIEDYRDALKLSPDFIEAAENMEMAKLGMQSVLDQMKKQEEMSEKQKQEQQATEDQMQELIEKQKQLKDMTEDIKDQAAPSAEQQKVENKMKMIAEEQKKLSTETKALSDKLPGSQSDQSLQEQESKRHLSGASEQQEKAVDNLISGQTGKALENQQLSIDELKKAIDSLADNQKNDQKGQHKPDGEGSESISKDINKTDEKEEKFRKEAREEANDALDENDTAAILDEEKENMKNRRHESTMEYKDVMRDW